MPADVKPVAGHGGDHPGRRGLALAQQSRRVHPPGHTGRLQPAVEQRCGHHRPALIGGAHNEDARFRAALTAQQIKYLENRPSAVSQVTALVNQAAVLKEEVAQLQVNGAVSTSGVEFVTPAQRPASPSSPKPMQDALLGLAAGLMLGLGGAFLRDTLDDTLTSKDPAERLGNAPVLAMVPMVSSWKKRKRSAVAVSSDPTSPAAEAYRSLRTSVQFTRQAHNLRTLLVTSPASAEGKTSTLANLGAVFAQAGERVVLVSCDLRRPRLGALFDIDEKPGLISVLLGERTLEQALQQVEGYDCLRILGAGAVPPNPAELLNGPKARQIFATLRENYDLVLVDSPPVLPVTDALVLSTYADSTLLVVAAGQVSTGASTVRVNPVATRADPAVSVTGLDAETATRNSPADVLTTAPPAVRRNPDPGARCRRTVIIWSPDPPIRSSTRSPVSESDQRRPVPSPSPSNSSGTAIARARPPAPNPPASRRSAPSVPALARRPGNRPSRAPRRPTSRRPGQRPPHRPRGPAAGDACRPRARGTGVPGAEA